MNITKHPDADGFRINLSEAEAYNLICHLRNVADLYEDMVAGSPAIADSLRAKAEQARTWAKSVEAKYDAEQAPADRWLASQTEK